MTQSPDPGQTTGAPQASPPARRSKEVSKLVHFADKAADILVPAGGLFVIFAVFGIMVFLLVVVLPLFQGGKLTAQADYAAGGAPGPVLMTEVDEYQALAVTVSPSGAVSAFHALTGTALTTPSFDFGGKKATAYARTFKGGNVAFGFEDGTVRFGRIAFKTEVLAGGSAPQGLKALNRSDRTDGSAVFSRIPGNQVRKVSLELVLAPPQQIAEPGTAIAALDYRVGGMVERPTRSFVTVDARGNVRLSLAETRINMLTRKPTTVVNTATLEEMPKGVKVVDVLLTDRADQVYVAEEGGTVFRFDTRDFAKPVLAERKAFFPAGVKLTGLAFLIGEQSIIAAGSDGAVDVYFRLQRQGAATKDGFEMVRGHRLEPHAGPVRRLDVSKRTKMLVTADAGGNVWLRHATSEQVILRMKGKTAGGYDGLSLAPRDDGVLAVAADRRASLWSVHAPHPETTWHSLFGAIWYEGYPEPSYTWQSSSGTDTFEPKFSLVPLVFGTIKATLYSLMFAIPIALLAAVYTSEFVHPAVRGTLKPVMEMMASLPSVVLGFIAALILAPIVERWIASVFLLFVLFPLSLVGSAYLWQLVPLDLARRLDGLPKFALMFVAIFGAFGLSWLLGARFERLFFYGDLRAWVNGDVGTGAPFLFLVFLPGACLAVFLGAKRWLEDWTRGKVQGLSELQGSLFAGARWLVLLAAAALAAWAVAWAASALGLDPRGGVVGTYVQRNVLVVGFAMGFAVIPIIYTIAEDALNAVPSHLRAASLACGATPWQTAWRVVLPTAMSGVFAAVMVGMGRAVGETMIVVMAAGNTPILDWNLFNGLRALSANIAVELPEAVKDGTLYRVLFLAGLTLFVMTFILNTLAEIVRIRFRKRAVQL